jgi:hypothetical protein
MIFFCIFKSIKTESFNFAAPRIYNIMSNPLILIDLNG